MKADNKSGRGTGPPITIRCFSSAPSIDSIFGAIGKAIRWLRTAFGELLPTTMGQWGVIAVVGAFIALGLGMFASLRKKTPE